MRLIGNLTDQKNAESFVAFLLTLGIQSHIEQEHGAFEVWIKDEDSISEAMKELEAFKVNPADQKYAGAISKARKIQEEQIQKQKRIVKNVVNVSDKMGRRNHPLTILLIVICGLVALLTSFGAAKDKATFRSLSFNGLAAPDSYEVVRQNNENMDALSVRLASVSRWEFWRLVTPAFLHHDVFHLLFNMYWLFLFGSQIENRYGTFWFGVMVILSAAISNFAQCVVPENIGGSAPSLLGPYLITGLGGMSGVVYALFGFIWMRMTYDRASGLFLPQSTVFILVAWLLFCISPIHEQVFNLRVANWAHAIGLLVGVIAGYWPTFLPQRTPDKT